MGILLDYPKEKASTWTLRKIFHPIKEMLEE